MTVASAFSEVRAGRQRVYFGSPWSRVLQDASPVRSASPSSAIPGASRPPAGSPPSGEEVVLVVPTARRRCCGGKSPC